MTVADLTADADHSRRRRLGVADHDLLRVIRSGGGDRVWLARHRTRGTLRAVKIVHRAEFDDDRPFHRELEGVRRYEPVSHGYPKWAT